MRSSSIHLFLKRSSIFPMIKLYALIGHLIQRKICLFNSILKLIFHIFFTLNIFINFNLIFFFSAIAVGGADMTTKIYAIKKLKNLSVYTLGSHTDAVVGCFFEENSLNVSFIFN